MRDTPHGQRDKSLACKGRFLGAWLACMLALAIAACGPPEKKPANATIDAQQAQADADDATGFGTDTDTYTDSGGGLDAKGADCVANPGASGCPCASNAGCINNFCIETPDGRQCARTCVDTCPDNATCNTVSSPGGDSISICVPRWGRQCDPCSASADCKALGLAGAACVDFGAAGHFCGIACQVNADCAGGFACKTVTTAEKQEVKQCVPIAELGDGFGACTCSALASLDGLKTTCAVQVLDKDGKLIGQCPGERICVATGLTACLAPEAKPELCDGVDNDCNGVTDEGTCDDQSTCTQDACKAQLAGEGKEGCVHEPLEKPCDADGSVCTDNDHCVAGVCKPGPLKSCGDGNPCTQDVCDPASGCTQTADDGVTCTDSNPCTIGDICKDGGCQKGKQVDCDLGKPCIAGTCDMQTGGCIFLNKANGLDCDDGQACTELDTCLGGACNGKVKNCDDGNPCTMEACDPTIGCKYVNSTATCSDGNACTTSDVCKDGLCTAKDVSCDDGNVCTSDTCEAKTGCSNAPAALPCSDADACTLGDLCQGGACVAGATKSCDDKSTCSTDACDAKTGLCTFDGTPFEGAACDADASICTVGDKCTLGKCAPGKAKACDDNNPCTDDDCDATKGCVKSANTAPCNADDNSCTDDDHCVNNACVPGKDKVCDDANPCTSDSCNLATGKCDFSGTPQNGALCDADFSVCTVGDACALGKCVPGKPKDCNDGNACTDDTCAAKTGCDNAGNTDPCDDLAPCTVGDACAGGKCVAGKAKVCDDKNACSFDSCNPSTGVCEYDIKAMEGIGCDADGSVCTASDKCIAGKCSVGGQVNCDDANACTTDACEAKSGCNHVNNTIACNDGNACTGGDTCKDGKCAASAVNCDDANACTIDSCDSLQGCLHKPQTDGMLCAPDMVCASALCKPAVCGDGVIQGAVEACDGAQLKGNTCSSLLGQGSDGKLKCATNCKSFDTTGCIVDLSWMDMSDTCKGFRQAKLFPNVHFAVAKVNVWDKAKTYQCPLGHHWAKTSEGNALFTGPNGTPQEFTYYGQCGWVGDKWPASGGLTRSLFRFSDSASTEAHKHVGFKEGDVPGTSPETAGFAGIVCFQD